MNVSGGDLPGVGALRARPYWQQLAVIALAYFIAGWLGLRISLVGRSITPLWAPTGVAVVALLAFGRRSWPAITVAAFAINLPISPTALAALVIAFGNTLAPLAAVTLLSLVDFRSSLERVRDATALVLLGAFVAMTISATIGTLALLASGAIAAHQLPGAWSVWWTGDAMGVLIFAPFLWSLTSSGTRRIGLARGLEVAAVAAALIAACAAAASEELHLMFVVLPVLGIIVWRFGQRGAARANLLVSVLATVGAVHEIGPFANVSLVARMVTLQSFNATVAFTSILLAAAVAQRQQVARRQREAVEMLQRSLMPDEVTQTPEIEAAARYIPASTEFELGGDWYDIIALPRGRLGFVVGDVAGHGILASAVMGKIRMGLRAYALEDQRPGTVLERLNRLLRDTQPGATATVWYGQYDPSNRGIVFANAGHVPPLVLSDKHLPTYLEDVHGPPIGGARDVTYGESESHLAAGTTLLLYTDGLVDRRGDSIEAGLQMLQQTAYSSASDLESICDGVIDRLTHKPSRDDVALLAIRAHSLAGDELHLRQRATPAAVPEARRVMRAWLADNGVGPDDAFDVLVATSEACSNVVAHAYGLIPGPVELRACLEDSALRVIVRDSGSWSACGAGGDSGGRGLQMIRALMHNVEIITDNGTEIRMRRRLHSPARPGRASDE